MGNNALEQSNRDLAQASADLARYAAKLRAENERLARENFELKAQRQLWFIPRRWVRWLIQEKIIKPA